jgi:glycosyltransferase involved in cell wall biosynthesis
MLFSVDAHAIGRHLTGNEVYVRNLLSGFASLDDDSEFIAYVSQESAAVPSFFVKRMVACNPFMRLGFNLPWKLRQDCPDLIHVQYTAPVACRVPVVVSVHDISFLEHPEYFPAPRALQLRWTVRRTIALAAKVLTGSEFSRRTIEKAYGLDPEKIKVVPNAASAIFRPVLHESAVNFVRTRFQIMAPFILSVGDLQPRKNQIGLIGAFAEMIRSNPQLPHHLVFAGKETWHAPKVASAAATSGVADRIHFTGFVADEELVQLYNACDLFAFPSFYEGFGLPVLEAMACGRAVACSNTSALPEVADAAAILFDPHSREAMVRAMTDLLLQPELRARMERLGLHQASHFSWQLTAKRTLEVYYEVARNRARTPSEQMKSAAVLRP